MVLVIKRNCLSIIIIFPLEHSLRHSGIIVLIICIIIITINIIIIIIIIIERMRRSHRHPQGSESQTKQKSVSRLGIEPRSSDLRSDALAD